MRILDALFETLDLEAEVRDVRLGLFQTGVLTRRCGLASTLPKDALKHRPMSEPLVTDAGHLLEKSAGELARLSYSDNLPEATIGMATINSLLEIDEQRCRELNAGDLIDAKGAGKKVAIVGHFPFIPRLRESAGELWVIEKNPREGDRPESDASELIPRADVVGVTGATLMNHTLEQVLDLCSPGAYVVVLGDSTPLSPLLFEYGVDAISGTLVVDPALALRCVSQGATFRQIKGRRLLTMLNSTGRTTTK